MMILGLIVLCFLSGVITPLFLIDLYRKKDWSRWEKNPKNKFNIGGNWLLNNSKKGEIDLTPINPHGLCGSVLDQLLSDELIKMNIDMDYYVEIDIELNVKYDIIQDKSLIRKRKIKNILEDNETR